jgi:hypothetical protein
MRARPSQAFAKAAGPFRSRVARYSRSVVYVAGRVLLIGFVFFVGILLTLGALALVVLILA